MTSLARSPLINTPLQRGACGPRGTRNRLWVFNRCSGNPLPCCLGNPLHSCLGNPLHCCLGNPLHCCLGNPLRSILKGLYPPAQGCEERATLGKAQRGTPTLKGLEPPYPIRNQNVINGFSVPGQTVEMVRHSATLNRGVNERWLRQLVK